MLIAEPKEKKARKSIYKSRRWWIITAIVLGLAALVYAGICIYIASEFTTGKVRDLGPDTPATYGMAYDDITFKTADKANLTISGWWIPRLNSNRVLIMVHARDGTRTFLLPMSYRLWQEGFNILMFDTRGQGRSEGARYSFGWHEKYDVLGAVNFVKAKGFQPDKIGAVGRSMGAAIVLQAMALSGDIKAGVSESSFGNLDQTIQSRFSNDTHLPLFFYPGAKLAALWVFDWDIDQTSPEQAMQNLGERKVFLIHDQKDTEMPLNEYYRLLKAGGKNVSDSWLIPDSEHVRGFENHPDEYIQKLVTFFNRELN